jgi:hypothetical protein
MPAIEIQPEARSQRHKTVKSGVISHLPRQQQQDDHSTDHKSAFDISLLQKTNENDAGKQQEFRTKINGKKHQQGDPDLRFGGLHILIIIQQQQKQHNRHVIKDGRRIRRGCINEFRQQRDESRGPERRAGGKISFRKMISERDKNNGEQNMAAQKQKISGHDIFDEKKRKQIDDVTRQHIRRGVWLRISIEKVLPFVFGIVPKGVALAVEEILADFSIFPIIILFQIDKKEAKSGAGGECGHTQDANPHSMAAGRMIVVL